ncbi:TPA: glycosyltransferase [Candidatus Gastranaerophilales bacterium HUM_20]|nr:putative bactoprenol glucosyl transferase-like protein [Clostridium sp. CAG:729]DAB24656.1 MAG TPA: glycosyltransferase [Candidatus Gastranaerophilales bacterium HUM_20]
MEKPRLAIIVPCFNEELCVKSTVEQLLNVLNKLVSDEKIKPDSYIYLVDDGSVDKTWKIIEEFHNKNKLIKGLKFVRNFGNQKALLAGLDCVRAIGCDCAVSIDADLQQDEWAIEKFVDEYMKGADIVSGIRNDRKTDSFFKKITALMFYKTMNILGAKIPPNHSDYRLVSKRALDILEQYPEKYLFLRGFFNEVGLKTAYVNFDVKPRMAGESKFNFVSLMGLALNGITSYSVVPLRFVAVLGFCMALFGFLVGVETVIEKIFWHNSPNGWATTIILLCVFGGIQLFCLGLIGEYVGQVYREVKARPRYIKDIELK